MKWIAVAIVVLALAVIGAAVVAANDSPDCVNTTNRFAENRC